MHVDLGCLGGFMAKPERDHGDVDARMQETHGGRMSEDVGRHLFRSEGRAANSSRGDMFGHDGSHCVATQSCSPMGSRKKRIIGLTALLVGPCLQHCDRRLGEGGDALLSALPGAPHMCPTSELDVLTSEPDQLGDA